MQLKVLSYPDCEQARIWRNDSMSMNRTPYLLTQEQQGRFYQEQVNNRLANARYWGIWEESKSLKLNFEHKESINYPVVENPETEQFIGMGEITNISPENRNGEIGLIMHPEHLGEADKAIDLILEQGFDNLNLENIFGECYLCSPYLQIWETAARKYNAICNYLPNRKYWDGKYYGSLNFNINREVWKECLR